MSKKTIVQIKNLRPNSWYLSSEKLDRMHRIYESGMEKTLPPISAVEIDGTLALIDGHCRAYVAWERGIETLPAAIGMPDDGCEALYRFLHMEGPKKGIEHIWDLKTRILEPDDFEQKWVKYCEEWVNQHKKNRI